MKHCGGQLRRALWHGGGDAEDQAAGKGGREVVFCSAQRVLTSPRQDETAPSNQNIPAGVLGKAEEGTLPMKALDDRSCDSFCTLPCPGDAACSPKKTYGLSCVLAGDELKIASPLQAGLCLAVLSSLVGLLGVTPCGTASSS